MTSIVSFNCYVRNKCNLFRKRCNRTYKKDGAFNLADDSTSLRAPFNRLTRIGRAVVMQPITDTDIFMFLEYVSN
jgi:hypothetical protein